jgi:hypothetical protein
MCCARPVDPTSLVVLLASCAERVLLVLADFVDTAPRWRLLYKITGGPCSATQPPVTGLQGLLWQKEDLEGSRDAFPENVYLPS